MAFSEQSNCVARPWTEGRVERLKELLHEGFSASQIAARLGGFSHTVDGGRSAVIGKIHRLGLSGSGTKRKRQLTPGGDEPRVYRKPRPKRPQAIKHNQPQANWRAVRKTFSADEQGFQKFAEIQVPEGQRKQLVDLEENNCLWPIGDPKHDDFHFCNDVKVPGLPYCEHHCAVAYRAPETKPRARARQKIRSFEDA